MKAIVLAAGRGRRLGELTREVPKALVAVKGKPLVDWVCDWLTFPGIDHIVVVGGFAADRLEAHVSKRAGVSFAFNPDFRKGSVLTLNAARPFLNGDVLLCNVDHIYPTALLRRFFAADLATDAPTAFVDFDRPLFHDDMKVQLDSRRRIVAISKTLREFEGGYIGSTFIPAAFLPRYLEALDRVIEQSQGNANVEAALQQLANDGSRPRILDTSGIHWLEVDTQEDRAKAEHILTHAAGYLE